MQQLTLFQGKTVFSFIFTTPSVTRGVCCGSEALLWKSLCPVLALVRGTCGGRTPRELRELIPPGHVGDGDELRRHLGAAPS